MGARQFEATPAVRDKVPLLVGLFGPSSSGKTFTALRLATGMQSFSGGDIYVIDTETKRAKHYADVFKFHHVPFAAPFGSLDYLEAITYCADKGAGTIIIDSMSHEHEGTGGYLRFHDTEAERLSKEWRVSLGKAQIPAWAKPAQHRRDLINGILQINANFIFCFRAKQKLKIVKGQDPIELGWMPIAGEEFLFEMMMNVLFEPAAKGIPTWHSEAPGERMMLKLPRQFADLAQHNGVLDEGVGRRLAEWAAGENPVASQPSGQKASTDQKPAKMTPTEWANDQAKILRSFREDRDPDAFEAWLTKNGPALDKLKAADLSTWESLNGMVTETRAATGGGL
ncbi:MAG: AAA family ATPase [Alphaproteobacteria bacterium]|nr:AAA family ATPase [Alphaproteobacteria bacterium]